MKRKVSVPLVVAQNGEVQDGYFGVDEKGFSESNFDVAIDCLSKEAFDSGFRVIYVECEIDVDKLFEDTHIKGEVKIDK